MGQALAIHRATAKIDGVKSGPSKGHKLYQILPFELLLREIWPQDRTKNYMRETGAAARTAKRRISGKNPPKGYEEIVALLRTDHGIKLLQLMMGDARPQWFVDVLRSREIGEMRRQQQMLNRRLAQMEMGV